MPQKKLRIFLHMVLKKKLHQKDAWNVLIAAINDGMFTLSTGGVRNQSSGPIPWI